MTHKSKTPAATGALGNGSATPAPASNTLSRANRKAVRFRLEGRSFKLSGGLARSLGLMIDAGAEGIDRHMCSEWWADLPRGICKLRKTYGLEIETVRGRPTRYVLLSPVCRDTGEL